MIFDDGQAASRPPEADGYTAYADPNFFLFHLLSYLETPPYLRKTLFSIHPDLRTAGSLPSLDMPHHVKAHEWSRFREGVTGVQASDSSTETIRTVVHCGIDARVEVAGKIPPNNRLTVKLPCSDPHSATLLALPVGPSTPREEDGYYWGYTVRQATSLSAIFTESEFEDGYDFSIGTSERGTPINLLMAQDDDAFLPPSWNHLLLVVGGVAGLETAFEADVELRQSTGATHVKDLFDRWINILPGQGSRTIRTEEALWIALSRLRPSIEARAAAFV